MDLQQQFEEFRVWAMDFYGPSQRWMWAALAIVGTYIAGSLLSRFLHFSVHRLAGLAHLRRKDATQTGPRTADHVMVDILGALVRVCFLLFGLALAANLLFGFSLDRTQLLALAVLRSLGILVGVWFLGSWLSSRVRRFGEKVGRRAASGRTLFHFLAALVRFGAFSIGLIAALQQFGFPIASLVAIVGAAGLAIGLALQDTLKAVAAGVIIAVFRPYRIGDVVQISGQTGTVVDITPFTTVLTTLDNKEITITNDKAWGDTIVNHSARSMRLIDLPFSISYEDDIDRAIEIIRSVVAADARARDEPPVWVNVTALSAFSVDLRLRVWCASGDWWNLQCDLLKTVKQAFDREGVTIPYPHQVEIQKQPFILRTEPARPGHEDKTGEDRRDIIATD